MPWTGPDWGLFRKLSLAAFAGVLCWSLLPWLRCSFAIMDSTQIVDVDDAHGHGMGDSADVLRAQRAEEFLGGFFGPFGVCYALNPVGGGDNPWQWPAIGGTLAAAILFRRLDRWQYARRVRRMNVNHVEDFVSANRRAVQHTPSAIEFDDPFELPVKSREATTGRPAAARDATTGRPALTPREFSTDEPTLSPRDFDSERPAALRRMSSNNVAAGLDAHVDRARVERETAPRGSTAGAARPARPSEAGPEAAKSAAAARRLTGVVVPPELADDEARARPKNSKGPDWEWD